MIRTYITHIAEQPPKGFMACNYVTEDKKLYIERAVHYPIINLIENDCEDKDELVVIAIKQKGENFDLNLETLKKEINEFVEKKELDYKLIVLDRMLEETNAAYMDIFKKIVNAVPDNCVLSADITYGTKPFPSLLTGVFNYVSNLKFNTDVDKLVYGKIEWATKQSHIYEVSRIVNLNLLIGNIISQNVENPKKVVDLLLGIE